MLAEDYTTFESCYGEVLMGLSHLDCYTFYSSVAYGCEPGAKTTGPIKVFSFNLIFPAVRNFSFNAIYSVI
jgi:hypothetical protein